MMKRFLLAILICATIFGMGAAAIKAAELQPISFPFIGRWQPSEDPVLLDDYGLQDIQNVRKSGKHFKGISGHTIINSTSLSSYKHFFNGFHFYKDSPQESHVIVLAGASVVSTTTYLFQNTTAIPGTGSFSATSIHADATGAAGIGRFSFAPGGNMVYANGPETLIWGGNEIPITAFLTSDSSLTGTGSVLTNPKDYSEQLSNTRTTIDQVALIGEGIDSNTLFLLHMDGADGGTVITDSISTTRVITAAASAQTDTDQFKFSTASLFLTSATTDYIYTSADSVFDLPATGPSWEYSKTYDFWYKHNGTISTGTTMCFFQQYQDSNNYYMFYSYNSGIGGRKLVFDLKVGGTTYSVSNAHADFTANVWHHIEVSVLFTGTVMQVCTWFDGVQASGGGGAVSFTGAPPSITGNFDIGNETATSRSNANGWLDEFRISNGRRHYSDFITRSLAYQNAQKVWVVGSPRPLQGVKYYVSEANQTTSTLSVKEWNGASWTAVTATDNTSSGGVSLYQTGTVTWSSTVDTSKPKYINGYSLYWYQFELTAGSAVIYYTTLDAPMQPIRNIWNGTEVYVAKCYKYDATTYVDYTDAVNDDTDLTYLDVSSLSTSGYLLLGFVQPMQGFDMYMVAGSENSTASTGMTVSYSNGATFATVTGLNDGTATSTKSLSKSGVVSFQGLAVGEEFMTAINDQTPLYYYKVNFAGAPDASTQVAEIRGIPFPKALSTYSFSETFQNRLFLFSEYNGLKNKVIYSEDNSPDIFNGSDIAEIYVGGNDEIIAAKAVYNVFGNSAYEQLIIGKKNEIYRLSGDDPTTWNVKRISANIGVIAPLSMVTCEISGKEEDTRTQVIIWQGDKGFYMTDGSLVVPISDDIKCYFDPNDSRYIPTARRSKTVAWYDPSIRAYKALISSGSGQTIHNIELEYSLLNKEWTKIYRTNASGADPLQCGFQVFDTSGIGYTYGGTKGGYLYRLENGTTFAGTTIPQYLHTKDLILDSQAPLFRKSTVKYVRTAHKKKTAAAGGGSIAVTHYGDQIITSSGSSNQVVPSTFSMASAPYNTQSCAIGPFLYHSFKFTASDTTATDGMELIGLAIWAEPYTAIR